MSVLAHWDGRKLYAEWCGSPFSDRAAYWREMNPADKAHWKELAKVINQQHRGAVDVERIARVLAEHITAVTVRREGEPVDVCRFHRDLARAIVGGQ